MSFSTEATFFFADLLGFKVRVVDLFDDGSVVDGHIGVREMFSFNVGDDPTDVVTLIDAQKITPEGEASPYYPSRISVSSLQLAFLKNIQDALVR